MPAADLRFSNVWRGFPDFLLGLSSNIPRAAHRTVTVTAVILLAADGYGSTVTVTVMPDSLG